MPRFFLFAFLAAIIFDQSIYIYRLNEKLTTNSKCTDERVIALEKAIEKSSGYLYQYQESIDRELAKLEFEEPTKQKYAHLFSFSQEAVGIADHMKTHGYNRYRSFCEVGYRPHESYFPNFLRIITELNENIKVDLKRNYDDYGLYENEANEIIFEINRLSNFLLDDLASMKDKYKLSSLDWYIHYLNIRTWTAGICNQMHEVIGGRPIYCFFSYQMVLTPVPSISDEANTSFKVEIGELYTAYKRDYMELKINDEVISSKPDEPWIIEVPNYEVGDMLNWDYEFRSTSPNTDHTWSSNVEPSFGLVEIHHVE